MYILSIKNSDTFDQIISGSKSVEVRKQSKYINCLKPNTFIMFKHQKNYCIKYITFIKIYDSLFQLLEHNILLYINKNLTSISNTLVYYEQYYKNTEGKFYAVYLK